MTQADSKGPIEEPISAPPPPAAGPAKPNVIDPRTGRFVSKSAADTAGDPRRRVIEEIARVYSVHKALKSVGITRREFRRWCEDDNFREEVEDAQQDFVDDMEGRLIRLARDGKGGKAKGDYMSLVTFLNAHHFSYGRVRAEMMERALLGFVDQVMTIVAAKVPRDIADSVRAELLQAAFTACFAAGGGKRKGARAT